MSSFQCENCQQPITAKEQRCSFCGFPQKGSKEERIQYNTRLLKFKDLVEESDRSLKTVFSLALIFIFMGLVVLAFSLIFGEDHYFIALFLIVAGKVYYLLNRLGMRNTYMMMILVFIFYMLQTIFEFSNGYFPKSPVDLNDSFMESKGSSILYAAIPLIYIIIRVALMIVLIKYLYAQIRLKSEEKMVRFIKNEKSKS